MANYGYDPEETHESMHIHRRERHYGGHKLAVAVGHNRAIRSELKRSKARKVK
jgi:hypothetical protein